VDEKSQLKLSVKASEVNFDTIFQFDECNALNIAEPEKNDVEDDRKFKFNCQSLRNAKLYRKAGGRNPSFNKLCDETLTESFHKYTTSMNE